MQAIQPSQSSPVSISTAQHGYRVQLYGLVRVTVNVPAATSPMEAIAQAEATPGLSQWFQHGEYAHELMAAHVNGTARSTSGRGKPTFPLSGSLWVGKPTLNATSSTPLGSTDTTMPACSCPNCSNLSSRCPRSARNTVLPRWPRCSTSLTRFRTTVVSMFPHSIRRFCPSSVNSRRRHVGSAICGSLRERPPFVLLTSRPACSAGLFIVRYRKISAVGPGLPGGSQCDLLHQRGQGYRPKTGHR